MFNYNLKCLKYKYISLLKLKNCNMNHKVWKFVNRITKMFWFEVCEGGLSNFNEKNNEKMFRYESSASSHQSDRLPRHHGRPTAGRGSLSVVALSSHSDPRWDLRDERAHKIQCDTVIHSVAMETGWNTVVEPPLTWHQSPQETVVSFEMLPSGSEKVGGGAQMLVLIQRHQYQAEGTKWAHANCPTSATTGYMCPPGDIVQPC